MTEADWQNQVIELARLFKWRVAHFRPAQTSKGWRTPVAADGKGFPDLCLVRERVVWAELKAEKKYLAPDQQAWFTALNNAGCEVYLWRPADADEVVRVLGRKRLEQVQLGHPVGALTPAHRPTPRKGVTE